MQTIKTHKILSFFNLLALLLIIFGMSTDFTVPDSGTSISGGIAAWGELLLVIIIIADGVVIAKQSSRKNTPQAIVNDGRLQRKSRLSGISIIIGAFLGLLATYLILAPQGEDAGLLFLPLAALLAPLGAFLAFVVTRALRR